MTSAKVSTVLFFVSLLLVGFVASGFALTVRIDSTGEIQVHEHAYVKATDATHMLTGINLMDGSAHTSSLNYMAAHIKYLSCRVYWALIEPSEGTYSTSQVNTYKALMQACQDRNISVNFTFWTQFQSGAEDPSWVKSKPGYNYYFKATDPTTKTDWLDFVGDMVDEFKAYTCIGSWSYMNEPFYSTTTQKNGFVDLCDQSYTLITGKDSRPVTCRFGNSYSPGSGRFPDSVYNYVDVMGLTVYSYPWQYHLADSRTDDTVFNGKWWMYKDTVSDCADLGLPLWLIEFGADRNHAGLPSSFSEEDQREFYEDILKIFNDDGVARAYAWAWRTSNAASQLTNLWTGSRVKDAYWELTKYPLPSPECIVDSDCSTGQICVNGVCVDQPEPPPPAQYWQLDITHSRGGYTVPVSPQTYTYLIGDSAQVTAYPQSNHTFTSWTLDGDEVSTNPVITVTGASERTYFLYALFTEDTPTPPDPPTEWTLTMGTNTGGNVAPAKGSHLIDTLSTSATASADDEYSFARWLWDGATVYTDNPVTVTAAFGSYHTLEAFFTADPAPPSPDPPTIIPKLTLPTVTPSGLLKNVTQQLEATKPHSFNDVVKALSGRKPRSFNDIMRLLEDAT